EKHISFVANLMTNTIQLSEDIVLLSQELNDIIYYVYLNLFLQMNHQYLVECSILTFKNNNVNTINSIVIRQFSEESVEYLSANIIVEQTKTDYQYQIEFLNSLNIG
ncbi:13843_t:CDS:1, partial [Racocetra persica]